MKNIGRCPKCQAFLIGELWANHDCRPKVKGVKEIPISFYTEAIPGRLIIARGHDGYFYRLIKRASDDSYHKDSSDEDLTEPFTIIHLYTDYSSPKAQRKHWA